MKDDELQLLIECFTGGDGEEGIRSKFSERFIEVVIKVVKEKRDRFQLKTLTHLIWSFAKVPALAQLPSVRDLLIELRDYDRLRQSLGNL